VGDFLCLNIGEKIFANKLTLVLQSALDCNYKETPRKGTKMFVAGLAGNGMTTVHVALKEEGTNAQGAMCVANMGGNSHLRGLSRDVRRAFTYGEAETRREALAQAVAHRNSFKVCKVCAKISGYEQD
jgi:adenylylsulfate kinase-like enzyme